MVKWAMEFFEYDLEFQPQIVIKAQTLADFIAEGVFFGLQEGTAGNEKADQTKKKSKQTTSVWTLYVDGASSKEGC